MAEIEVPHLRWPFRYDRAARRFVTVEQDSLDDVEQSVYAYLATTRGERPLSPDFGLDDPTFGPGVDTAAIAAEIMDSEDGRADVTITTGGIDGSGRAQIVVTVALAE